MSVFLTLKESPDIPIEADTITPSEFAGKTISQISNLSVQQGNKSLSLKKFFSVKGKPGKTANDTKIILDGDLRKIKMIGRGMDGGRIIIDGNVGMYLGAEMKSGRIHVKGSVDDWAAAEMQGGNIQIEGDTGDYLCAGFRGSRDGMRGGRVYVGGNVGRELASHMQRGFIAIKGNVGSPCAARMMGGTIIIIGNVGERTAIQATRGMIICLGTVESVLPTYKFSGSSEREIVNYYLRYLHSRRPDFVGDSVNNTEKWMKFIGDFAEASPNEEIFVRSSINEHLHPGGK
ncbi:MAG: formylmethanofuran dehydrogenase subunit C [Candidatus Thorarchaeota archaeon]|nr:formylmethanofuran dehydrogenase subunit C [Candidatus Thorarchaeota archaeon]